MRPQPLQTPLHIHKGGHLLRNHSVGGFAKDGLPCIHVVGLVVVGTSVTFPAKWTMTEAELACIHFCAVWLCPCVQQGAETDYRIHANHG